MFALLLTATTAQAWWPADQGTVTLSYDANISAEDRVILDWAQDMWDTGPHDIRLWSTSGDTQVDIFWEDGRTNITSVRDPETDELTQLQVGLSPNYAFERDDRFDHTDTYGGDGKSFKAYALHMMGVVLDITRPDASGGPNIMGDWDEFSAVQDLTAFPEMGGGVLAALVDHHGEQSTPVTDLGILHYRQTGWSSGSGSAHSFTRVRASNDNTVTMIDLASYTGDYDVPVAKVPAGHRVYAEFLRDNQGTECVTMDYDLYLSTNTNITTQDTYLRWGGGINSCPGPATAGNYFVDVPANVYGLRYIGIVLDVVGDLHPENNAAWLPIEIVANGASDLCSYGVKCKRGYGDCDSNAECASGTTCRWNVGANYGFDPLTDVCE